MLKADVAPATRYHAAPSFDWLRERLSPANVVPVALGVSLLIGIGDFITGVDVAFTLLYVFPIALGTWFRDRRFGWILAVLCAGLSAAAEVGWRLGHHGHFHPFWLFWNHGGSLGIFVLCVEVLDRLRAYVESERVGRRRVIEQLRHAERLNVVGKLAAGVAHELGTPLNVISTTAELLDTDTPTPPMIHASCRVIVEQSGRMATIIRQLLDFGRRGGSDRSATDLVSLVESTVALMRPLARKRRVELSLTVPKRMLAAEVNRLEIGQVLSNLVLNAIQAMPNGGRSIIKLGVERERGVEVAVLSVSDEGTGIRPEDVPRVFDPFFTTKDVGEGTGLGLSVTYGIVSDHGGRVNVETEWGHGSTFTVVLPLRDPHAATRPHARTRESVPDDAAEDDASQDERDFADGRARMK
jgi:signal transduction histidine kinase